VLDAGIVNEVEMCFGGITGALSALTVLVGTSKLVKATPKVFAARCYASATQPSCVVCV